MPGMLHESHRPRLARLPRLRPAVTGPAQRFSTAAREILNVGDAVGAALAALDYILQAPPHEAVAVDQAFNDLEEHLMSVREVIDRAYPEGLAASVQAAVDAAIDTHFGG